MYDCMAMVSILEPSSVGTLAEDTNMINSPNNNGNQCMTDCSTNSSSNSRVELLGSLKNGMAVVYPPETTEAVVPVEILQTIDGLLRHRIIQNELQEFLQDEIDNSARHIQGGRIEIFLDATDKQSTFFDTVLGPRLPHDAKTTVLNYAREQALQDPRLSSSNEQEKEYVFGNFSIIVCEGACPPQAPHIDLIHPNYQFGLILSGESPGTLFFECSDHIKTVDALEEHWKNMALSLGENYQHPTEMSASLKEAMREDESVKILLDCFGDTLLPEVDVIKNMQQKESLPTGSLQSLPGSVLHAGPAVSDFRAVIFFSGWPKDSKAVEEYNPDVQYTGTLLTGQFAALLWRSKGIGYPERHFLLQRLAQYIENSTVGKLWAHFHSEELVNFVGNIEEKGYKTKYSRDAYIEWVARNGNIGGTSRDPKFAQLSVDNLYTKWDDIAYHVVVFQRIKDKKIILMYPRDGQDPEWEGLKPEEKFQLFMSGPNKGAPFDGSNGTLIDTDGQEVVVFTK